MEIFNNIKSRVRVFKLRVFNRKEQVVSIHASIGRNVILEGHNSIGAFSRLNNTHLGYGTYIGNYSNLSGCKVGRFCSIAPNVRRISGTHPLDYVSTHPAFYNPSHPCKICFVNRSKFIDYRQADETYNIVIGNDVWIGSYAAIIDGITIGDGAVIAAGAIVTKDVPPYAVVGGVPAKIIKYRFDEDTIERLLKARWWDRTIEWIKVHADIFTNVYKLLNVLENENE